MKALLTLVVSKKFIFSLGVCALSLSICLASLEMFLRFSEKAKIEELRKDLESSPVIESDITGLCYSLRPNHTEGEIRFNSLGFNMPELPKTKEPKTYRILFTGDSVTMGVGTTRTIEAYPNQVSLASDFRIPGGKIECWNCGVAGYNVNQIYSQIQFVLRELSPDLIVYGFNFNDYWPPQDYYLGHPATVDKPRPVQQKQGVLDQLKKIRLLNTVKQVYREINYQLRGYSPVYVDYKTDYPSWKKMKDVIIQMHDFCKTRKIRFAVLVLPVEAFLHRPDSENLAHHDIVSFLEAHKIAHFEPLEKLREIREERLYLKDGNHFTPKGYAILGQIVSEWLIRNSLLMSGELVDHSLPSGHSE